MFTHPFVKGVGLGMAAGAVVGVTMVKHQRTIKRKAKRAAHCMSSMMEDAADAIVHKFPH